MDKVKEEKIRKAVNELIGNGNVEIIGEIFLADYVAHAGDKKYSGHSFIRKFVQELRSSIPDLRVAELKFLSGDENTLAWQRILEGTNKTAMQGIPASGKKVRWVEMVVTRFEQGKIAEEWIVSELMGELLLKVPRIKK